MQNWEEMWSWFQDTRVWPFPSPTPSAPLERGTPLSDMKLTGFCFRRKMTEQSSRFLPTLPPLHQTLFSIHLQWGLLILQVSVEILLGSPPPNQVRVPSYNPGVPTQRTFVLRVFLVLWELLENRTWSPSPLRLRSLERYLAQNKSLFIY